jgi:hypothetical protein
LAIGSESQHVKFPSKGGDLENTQEKCLEGFSEISESIVKWLLYMYIFCGLEEAIALAEGI